MDNNRSKSNKRYDKNNKSDNKKQSNSRYNKNNKNERFGINNKSQFANTRKTILENLNTKPEWIEELNSNPIPKIINKGNPAEVFSLLKNVYGLTHTHALYRLVESAVFRQKNLHKIAARQDNQKDTSKDLRFYYQLQKIHQLVDLGATDYLNVIV